MNKFQQADYNSLQETRLRLIGYLAKRVRQHKSRKQLAWALKIITLCMMEMELNQ